MACKTCDFLLIGAGAIGVSIARELRRRHRAKVVVIEKEMSAGQHASGRNSGVLHAGVYYKAGTLKARLCIDGNRKLRLSMPSIHFSPRASSFCSDRSE